MSYLKNILFFIVLSLLLGSCHNTENKEDKLSTKLINNPNTKASPSKPAAPQITFNKTEHDFGNVIEGEQVAFLFKFKNTGNADLLISATEASCGCTVASFSKDPIKPNESGIIEVSFDSKNRTGFQSKTVTVMSNAQPSKSLLVIKAKIVKPYN